MCIVQRLSCNAHNSLQSICSVGLGVILVLGCIGVPAGMIITGKTYTALCYDRVIHKLVRTCCSAARDC